MTSLHSTSVDVLVDAKAQLGEGPVWDDRSQQLLWVDIEAGIIHATDPVTGQDRLVAAGRPVGALAPRARGGYVLALDDGFGLLETLDAPVLSVAQVPDGPAFRMNDGKCDPSGAFLAGTTSRGDAAAHPGRLYRLGRDGAVVAILDDVGVSNGLAWSADGGTLFFVDTLRGAIDRFTYDGETGQLSDRQEVVAIPATAGAPDGLTIDDEGTLWVALWGGGAVHRYAPDGRFLGAVELPVSLVTCPTFGGPDLDVLYVTTAIWDLSPAARAREPLAGAVFACRVPATGSAPTPFAG